MVRRVMVTRCLWRRTLRDRWRGQEDFDRMTASGLGERHKHFSVSILRLSYLDVFSGRTWVCAAEDAKGELTERLGAD